MRSLRLMLAVTSISLICILCCSLVFALNQDEASVSLSWSSQKLYPNDTVSIRITFKSNYAELLRIYTIGLHFDWMPSDSFKGHDFTDTPVTVPSHGTYIFDPIVIQVPLNASLGAHSYFIGIDGKEGFSASDFSWNSSISTIQIHAHIEKIYSELKPYVENKLNGGIIANYESSEAQSLLQQAQEEFGNAIEFAGAERWNEAIESLMITDDFLDQAHEAEQTSNEQKAEQQSWLFYLAITAIVVIISIIVLVVGRRRKQTESVADQPLETIEEQS